MGKFSASSYGNCKDILKLVFSLLFILTQQNCSNYLAIWLNILVLTFYANAHNTEFNIMMTAMAQLTIQNYQLREFCTF